MIYLERQVNIAVYDGEIDSAVEGTSCLARLMDVSRANQLVLEEGDIIINQVVTTDSDYELPLPTNHGGSEDDRYAVFLECSKSVVITKTTSQSVTEFDVKGVYDETKGYHPGFFAFNDYFTKLEVRSADAGVPSSVSYIVYRIPDLTDPDSFRDGVMTTGVL